MAEGACVDCSETIQVAAAHGSTCGGKGRPNPDQIELQKEGQAIFKMSKKGWRLVKGKLRCPACEAARKTANNSNTTIQKEEQTMGQPLKVVTPNTSDLRKPTPKQKREIIGILEDVYDDVLLRYRGQETDKTVADTVGINVMPGWVTELRDDMFGPDGGNDEMETLLEDMRKWSGERETEAKNVRLHIENAEAIIRENEAKIKEVATFSNRLAAVMKAVGPKSARA